jgi:serine O-acetyltransferase
VKLRRHRPLKDRPLMQDVVNRQPSLRSAVAADTRIFSFRVGEPIPSGRLDTALQALHLTWTTDAFGALLFYRIRCWCRRAGIPIVPALAHRMSIMWAQVCIGDPVLIEGGIYLPHGQVVIDGFTVIGAGARIRPFVTIGLVEGSLKGPTIGPGVRIGTGAKLIGPLVVGADANIGANAVVISDVEPGAVVVGVPARPLG